MSNGDCLFAQTTWDNLAIHGHFHNEGFRDSQNTQRVPITMFETSVFNSRSVTCTAYEWQRHKREGNKINKRRTRLASGIGSVPVIGPALDNSNLMWMGCIASRSAIFAPAIWKEEKREGKKYEEISKEEKNFADIVFCVLLCQTQWSAKQCYHVGCTHLECAFFPGIKLNWLSSSLWLFGDNRELKFTDMYVKGKNTENTFRNGQPYQPEYNSKGVHCMWDGALTWF